jgi:hypothetical protein
MDEGTDAAEAGHRFIAFAGTNCVGRGTLLEAALGAKRAIDEDAGNRVLVLDAETSEPVELDLRGTPEEVAARIPAGPAEAPPRSPSPGRPKLGVVAREVTLLPRHWEWLNRQPGGASVTLRKLVEEARRSTAGAQRRRLAQEACYRFMTDLAGDEPGYEEALRALYASDRVRFDALTEAWPEDIRAHARGLAAACMP